jgi:uncharacterized protein (DUF1684 family)
MNKIILGLAAVGILGIVIYSFSGTPNYHDITHKEFDTYKENLQNMADSPIKEKGTFDFFEPNEEWIVEADFIPSKENLDFSMDMTDSSKVSAKLAGEATFEREGKSFKVLIFEEEANYLLPFTDNTNGKDTYGGGRYVNIAKDDLNDDKISIDFNKARNFYCAYTESYICPIPPKENFINTEVNVGEKNYIK